MSHKTSIGDFTAETVHVGETFWTKVEGSCVAVGRNGCGDAALVFNRVSSKHHGGYLCHMSIAVSNVPFLGGGGDI